MPVYDTSIIIVKEYLMSIGWWVLLSVATAAANPELSEFLHDAIAKGNIVKIEELIARGAYPNGLYLGRTALQAAVVYKNPSVIGCLLTHIDLGKDDIIVRLLRSGNERYTISDVISSLKILLAADAHVPNMDEIPRGYLIPAMLDGKDPEAIHEQVIKMLHHYGKQKTMPSIDHE